MHLSPLLPLLLLPLTLASPIQPSLIKRNYVTRLLSRAGTFRSFSQVAPACAGEDCPEPTPEEKMCIERFGDSQQLRFPADPLNKTEVALGEDAQIDVTLCNYSTLVDERCVKYGVTDPWGISEKQAANEMKEYGFVGCPGTSDQLVHRVKIETGWSEKKVRRMMDLIAPGWDEAADDAIEEEKYQTKKEGGSKWGNGVWISAPIRQQPVVEKRPYNIPLDVAVRYLPPAPIQMALLGCYGWTVAKRGETCPKIIKRLNMSLEKFLELNPQVGGKGCPHLLSGYAYCTTTRAEADAALREKLGYPPQDVSFS